MLLGISILLEYQSLLAWRIGASKISQAKRLRAISNFITSEHRRLSSIGAAESTASPADPMKSPRTGAASPRLHLFDRIPSVILSHHDSVADWIFNFTLD
ncbi:MAG TPA: hypothetical protein QF557_05785 [Myxococcota bacterium]|nr:hypothetical protein [Myxococcota bacterium]MDP7297965.1 hypothetical protein [Myxococcota bacterium]HJO23043.1 hypothetical protein [Myxococcota bacterium]